MYTSLHIKNFRLFKDLSLTSLGKINLFFGPNNSGKTTILEAIYTHACGLRFQPFLTQVVVRRYGYSTRGALDIGERLISIFRSHALPPYTATIAAHLNSDSDEHILNLSFSPSAELADLDPRGLGADAGNLPPFLSADAQVPITVLQAQGQQLSIRTQQVPSVVLGDWVARLDGASQLTKVRIPLEPEDYRPPFKVANMHDILSHREPDAEARVFSYLKRYNILTQFTGEMRHIFPDITDIDMLPYPDGTMGPLYIAMADGRNVPLYAFGDGARRWFYLLGNMLVNQHACHCIEEIDATLHPAAHADLSRLLVRYSEQFDNQLFLTSHSIEFADSFLDALYGSEGDLLVDAESDPVRIFTIRRSEADGLPELWSMPGREAYEKRKRFDLELRW